MVKEIRLRRARKTIFRAHRPTLTLWWDAGYLHAEVALCIRGRWSYWTTATLYVGHPKKTPTGWEGKRFYIPFPYSKLRIDKEEGLVLRIGSSFRLWFDLSS